MIWHQTDIGPDTYISEHTISSRMADQQTKDIDIVEDEVDKLDIIIDQSGCAKGLFLHSILLLQTTCRIGRKQRMPVHA